MQKEQKKIRRRRKLIRLDLQLKIVFITLFVTSLVLLINFQLNLTGLWSLQSRFLESTNTAALLEAFRTSTLQKFLLSICMAVPLAASVGILYSFKFCGPIYRFKEYFRSIRDGRWDQQCRLRRGDDLQDVAAMINEAVEALRERVERNHEVLQRVKSLLDSSGHRFEGAGPQVAEELEAVRTAIEQEAVAYRNRFQDERGAEGAKVQGAVEEASDAESEAGSEADSDDREHERDPALATSKGD